MKGKDSQEQNRKKWRERTARNRTGKNEGTGQPGTEQEK
jgi:hypothetical protein